MCAFARLDINIRNLGESCGFSHGIPKNSPVGRSTRWNGERNSCIISIGGVFGGTFQNDAIFEGEIGDS